MMIGGGRERGMRSLMRVSGASSSALLLRCVGKRGARFLRLRG
jgi:hypothetical protein